MFGHVKNITFDGFIYVPETIRFFFLIPEYPSLWGVIKIPWCGNLKKT
jgi:hypothetical protein